MSLTGECLQKAEKSKVSEEDRISCLPDEILCQILSLLPAKVACTTTVLSKRWVSLYYSLMCLHFQDEDEEEEYMQRNSQAYLGFRRFVDTFMLSQHPHPIKKFRITCCSKLWGEDIAPLNADAWVEAAKQRRVEDFEICIQSPISLKTRSYNDFYISYLLHDEPYKFDDLISGVKVAAASMVKHEHLMANLKLLPGIFTCKTLVVLKLGGLRVGEVRSVELPSLKTLHLMEVDFPTRKDFMILLSGCPVLEDLHAPTVNYLQSDRISGFTNLTNLVKADIRALDVPLTILYNVEFLRIDWVELNKEYIFNRLKHSFTQSPNHDYYTIPVFKNLTHIELCYHHYGQVLRLLQHCPKLQILVTEKCFGAGRFYEDKPYPESIPECISLHLRTCSIKGGNYSQDFQFASYIMKTATLLQIMTIRNPTYDDSQKRSQDLEKLHSLCTSINPTCKISLTS